MLSSICRSLVLVLLVLAVAAADEPGKKGHTKANRLIHEKSPYLIQHAHNPVDWYPWGEEAFRAARESGKPIFLSIGYSTCHWCHVMERESFENEEIAGFLNEHFIAVKVDREERPDVDEVYMNALLAFRGGGGWPLSAFLTPEGKPFYLGTYFPPDAFKNLLGQLVEVWRDRKEQALKAAESFAKHLRQDAGPKAGEQPWTVAMIREGFQQIEWSYDRAHGGFGRAPKFPRTSNLDFLLAFHYLDQSRQGKEDALRMVLETLDRMARGGIYDHLGGGFHRYSTDREWLVPHFEKMLYDNVLIARTYLDAYRLTGKGELLKTARETLGYVMRVLRAQNTGGFHSAEDADSEGEEGKYYVFSRGEILRILGEEEGTLFTKRYGVKAEGNFESQGKNVLHIVVSLEDLAGTDKPVSDVAASLERSRKKLLEYRSRRVPPLKDDKVLTDWNALAVSAFSIAYQVTGDAHYLDVARGSADFMAKSLISDGALLHRYHSGEARYPAYLEDYAFLLNGLLDLYEASLNPKYLRESRRLAREMVEQFWDEKNGGFFQTGARHETLIARAKDFYDGAIPSGNSAATLALLRLVDYTGETVLQERAAVMAKVGATILEQGAQRHPQMLVAAAYSFSPLVEVVVSAGENRPAAAAFAREVHRRYLPRRTIALVSGDSYKEAVSLMPWIKEVTLPESGDGEKPFAMVRQGGGEIQKATSAEELARFLDGDASVPSALSPADRKEPGRQ